MTSEQQKKIDIRVTRMHHTDLQVAAMNDKDCAAILKDLEKRVNFVIDEEPLKGVFYQDLSVNFMYPMGASHLLNTTDIDSPSVYPVMDPEVIRTKIELSKAYGQMSDVFMIDSVVPPDTSVPQAKVQPKRKPALVVSNLFRRLFERL